MLAELGHEAVGRRRGPPVRPVAATLVIDEADAGLAGAVEAEGMRCVVAATVMTGPAEAAALARTVLGAGPGPRSAEPRPGSRRASELIPVDGIPEVRPGDVLADLIAAPRPSWRTATWSS